MTTIKVGVREFRERITRFLESETLGQQVCHLGPTARESS